MIKKILVSLTVLSVFLNVASVTLAQEAEQTKRWFCLEADRSGGHRAKLFIKDGAAAGEKPLPNNETIIVECIATDGGQKCTTGNGTLDQQLYGGSQMGGLGYDFQGLFAEDGTTPVSNPIPGNPTGTFAPVIWQDATDRSHERKWLGLNLVDPKPDIEMGQGGEQLGTFDFEFALKKCVNIAWDPYGRIFDSQNLEPVAGASVTLLKKRDDGIFTYVNPANPDDVPGGALINPTTTLEDGAFSFVVPDGTYKLSVQKAGYDFPSASTLNTNYLRVYSDIYPGQTGVEIVQAGSLQHRDIPLDAQASSLSSPAKIMEYIYESDKLGGATITGRVSHPLAAVNLYSVVPDANNPEVKTRYRLINTATADKLGRFSVTVDQSLFDLDAGETFGEVEVTAADLTLAGRTRSLVEKVISFVKKIMIKEVEAAASTIQLDPIPSYLEGYAYDSKGNPIPNAKVSVVLNFTTKPYYQTVADANGFFKVHSDYMPFQPYKLTYSSPQSGTISVSTAKFLTDNKAFIAENKIEAFKPNYEDPKVNEEIKQKLAVTAAAAQNKINNEEKAGETGAGTSANMGFIGMVALIIVLLIAAGAVVLFMLKRNTTTMY